LENSPYVCGGPAKKETELVDDVRGFTTVYVNQVGANDELLFHGGSMVLSSDGDVVARGATFEEDLVFVDIDGDGKPVQKEHIDHEWAPEYDGTTDALDEIAPEVLDALVLGVRDYCHKSGFEKAVVGSSGGIDSAVVLAIAVKALGAENVLAITMPSKFSSEGSVGASVALAENLGIELRNVSIEGIVDSFRGSIGGVKGIADENLQARARGTILMTISNGENRLVLATGNKAETAAGYCTLYGDTCGAIEVISDCPKMLVYAIAREINKDGEVIPQSVIDKAPSAELSPGQKDSDSLPGYPLLDRIVHERAENRRSIDEILALGLPISESELSRVLGLIDRAEFKRRQSPSGLRVTGGAFLKGGLDIPLVAKK
jgi:NAD+ synthase (glutamine-hydrolysing)